MDSRGLGRSVHARRMNYFQVQYGATNYPLVEKYLVLRSMRQYNSSPSVSLSHLPRDDNGMKSTRYVSSCDCPPP